MSDQAAPGDPTLDLPFGHGGPPLSGCLRESPEDFRVDEHLGYGPSGSGEHAFLRLRKRDLNTHDVARTLARYAGVGQVAVGYAGLKDRHAVTTQAFTVHLPGRADPDWTGVVGDGIEIVEATRHDRKIRRGTLRGNRFDIRVRQVEGDRSQADDCLCAIRDRGLPNYFGSQRFGHAGANLDRFARLVSGQGRVRGREQRSLLLSAGRAQLFNRVLAARVERGAWDRAIEGDVFCLAGSQRQFMDDGSDQTLGDRLARLDVHPTAPLCGRPSRALVPVAEAAALERDALCDHSDWIDGLARLGLDADRRPTRIAVSDLDWTWEADDLRVSFALPAGAYATAVLRELVRDATVREHLAPDGPR
jgi:tRNA pseudouridine13 synthase